MKRIFLIISLLACFAMSGNAQSKPIKVGLKMGPSIDWASSGSTAVANKFPRLGFGVGAVVDYHFAENFALSTGLNYNFLRMSYQFTDCRMVEDFLEEAQVSVDRRVRGTYFEMPVKAKVKVDVVDSWKAYVEAGLGLGVNYSDKAKDEYSFYWVDYADEQFEDYSYQYRLLQASLCFGLGAEFEVNSKTSCFAQVTFDHSLSNTFTRQLQKRTGSVLNPNFIGVEVGFLY